MDPRNLDLHPQWLGVALAKMCELRRQGSLGPGRHVKLAGSGLQPSLKSREI